MSGSLRAGYHNSSTIAAEYNVRTNGSASQAMYGAAFAAPLVTAPLDTTVFDQFVGDTYGALLAANASGGAPYAALAATLAARAGLPRADALCAAGWAAQAAAAARPGGSADPSALASQAWSGMSAACTGCVTPCPPSKTFSVQEHSVPQSGASAAITSSTVVPSSMPTKLASARPKVAATNTVCPIFTTRGVPTDPLVSSNSEQTSSAYAADEVLAVRFCAICARASPVPAMGGSGTSWIIGAMPRLSALVASPGDLEHYVLTSGMSLVRSFGIFVLAATCAHQVFHLESRALLVVPFVDLDISPFIGLVL
jgi:hypothetical protein